jgi:hypothetical protein
MRRRLQRKPQPLRRLVETPRTLDGRPDLTGIWIAPPFAAISAKFDQQGSGEIVIQGRDGSVENFENDNALRCLGDRNKPLYKPEYWAQVRENDANGNELDCGLEFMPIRNDGKTCSDTCRQRLRRGRRFAYLAELPQAQQQARRALHQAIEGTIALERAIRAARRERRNIGRRAIVRLAPLRRGPQRGGGILHVMSGDRDRYLCHWK